MTIAVAPAAAPPSTSRRRPVRGFRPRYEVDYPTLGWQVLAWTYAYLPDPLYEDKPFRYTDEQARRVLRMYELDPITGERLHDRVHEEEAKGWGKSPEAASIALAEFRGPVCFDGWDADGQPVGVPWGIGGRPRPWIQIAAVSEDQTFNTYRALYGFVTLNGGKTAQELRIDVGLTRLYQMDRPDAYLERVTASAGSREGQPITHFVADEPQLYLPENGGIALANTMLRNVTKTGGWGHFTGNAPIIDQNSVAEILSETPGHGPGVRGPLHFATRPTVKPEPDWTDEQMLEQLAVVYHDVPWVKPSRVLSDVRDVAAHPWSESLRFFFNWRDKGDKPDQWMTVDEWDDCGGDPALSARTPTYVAVRIAHDHRSAAVATAQRAGDQVHMTMKTFEAPDDELVTIADVEEQLAELRKTYRARVVGVKRYSVRGRDYKVPMAGPEIAYAGTFFESSAQRLRLAGAAMIDVPDSTERLTPAAESFKGLVLARNLVHDDDPVLADQLRDVTAKVAPKGWTLDNAGPAVRAAIVAVHRAMSAPREPSRSLHGVRRNG